MPEINTVPSRFIRIFIGVTGILVFLLIYIVMRVWDAKSYYARMHKEELLGSQEATSANTLTCNKSDRAANNFLSERFSVDGSEVPLESLGTDNHVVH